ncbi:hypothetical protein CVT24_011652 [Panaeolus cyanescens]|uniref:Uncharacterized protein n=1 Tax=Panaeolus cyanescens TaxID=181874 RepID=A0A409YH67_9AGAR|nr:hypothetical protein CVT24_011652 [Panaeolus cyanescens]
MLLLTMTLAEYNAKFPGQITAIPPSPSLENPGQVFPKSDPSKQTSDSSNHGSPPTELMIGNPYLMKTALDKLDHAFSDVLSVIEQERLSQNALDADPFLADTIAGWKAQLEEIRLKRTVRVVNDSAEESVEPFESPDSAEQGGLFAD